MLKKSGMLALALGLVVGVPFAFAAKIGTLTVSPTTVKPGGTITVSGSCGTANTNNAVRFSLDSGTSTVDLSAQGTNNNVTTDRAGNFQATLTVPQDFAVSNATLTATCSNSDTLTGTVRVSSSTTSSTGGTTGTTSSTTPSGGVRAGLGGMSNRSNQIILAAIVIVGGALLVTAVRRGAGQENA